jgi:ParB-like chromosome segregation protein Spo0J
LLGGDDRGIVGAESGNVTRVRLDEITVGEPIRAAGVDEAHVRILSESSEGLPPILVQASSMRVIDGMHRLRAAQIQGRTEIEARLLDISDAEAFLRGVAANVAHGLPLTLADRKSAALRIIELHPEWSDRAIGGAAGVSDKTVRALRHRHAEELPEQTRRIGLDGRVRPVDGAARRQTISELLSAHPQAALRQIAKWAGVSPGTVRRVRDSMDRNKPAAVRGLVPLQPRTPALAETGKESGGPRTTARAGVASVGVPAKDAESILQELRQDPTLRYRASGRDLLRLLGLRPALALRRKVIETIPEHRVTAVATLFRIYAQDWLDLAGLLETSVGTEREPVQRSAR